jgi:RimJ/RimL family protein N-acetyltransferase
MSLKFLPPVIVGQTPRILVRSWLETDIDAWISLSQDDGLNKFSLSGYRMKDREQAIAFIDRASDFFSKTQLIGAFPILLKSSSEMIGICGLKLVKLHDESTEKIEIMYRLAQPFWKKGYATEAGRILIEYAFKNLQLDKVIGFILPENIPSRAVLLRLGMSFVRKSKYSGHEVELFEICSSK